jgi:hypothetical protein
MFPLDLRITAPFKYFGVELLKIKTEILFSHNFERRKE